VAKFLQKISAFAIAVEVADPATVQASGTVLMYPSDRIAVPFMK